ncbi:MULTISPECIES: ABC transporter permease [unclassified Microbacterium]|uniref:ABC transporter permease n=1 Tax=unclassified Microbacterium TaxID=2609290 RepID=UPI000EA87A69|nr:MULTISPECIES: ABC transporter permease [unclassified Microbacterium]MBT2486493.1 ABC transporter permease [Microbacterium sp. ISL-108]RKN69190.1 ABC transporter permease [Microbacterium sp. CGR2]
MLSFLLRRLVAGLLTVVTICVVGFFLLYANSSDVARRIVGDLASPEIVARKAEELGLDRPVVTQFADWVGGVFTGDLGRSWFSGQPVVAAISGRLPVTLSLTIGAVLLTAIVGVLLGVAAASRRGAVDRAVQTSSIVAAAIPGFLVALILALIFGIWLRWLPATGYVRPEDSLTGWLSTITLPVIALSIGAIASIAQQVRGSMVDALRLDYVRTLRAHGLPRHRVLYRHVLRNAAGPALSVLGLQFVVLFGGAVVVEQVFSLPGVGQTAVSATVGGDIPLVMGILVATAILVLVVNLVVDLLQAWLNPRMRMS